jgi:hypothetical protein
LASYDELSTPGVSHVWLRALGFATAGKSFSYFARHFIIPPPLRSPEFMNKTATESVGIHRPQRQSLFLLTY